MKTKMPFDGFYLKLLDEQNGTHEYEEYLRNCKENPLTEEEQREWTESAKGGSDCSEGDVYSTGRGRFAAPGGTDSAPGGGQRAEESTHHGAGEGEL